MRQRTTQFLGAYRIYFAWLVSLVALGGSLFFSEIMHFVPCKLCWFERICMYPLSVLLGVAAYKNDHGIIPYVRTLSIIGFFLSLFHYLEQKVPGMHHLLPCTTGIPCSGQYINWLGFVTIPFLALSGFLLIFLLLSIHQERKN